MKENNQLTEWIEESNYIVFFGGAGVSTESGIPDFRSVDGLYNQQYKYPPETILSHSFFGGGMQSAQRALRQSAGEYGSASAGWRCNPHSER